MRKSPLDVVRIPRHTGELLPAAIFLATWISPASTRFLSDNIGDTLGYCMWLEFIMGHAATAFVVIAFTRRGRKSGIVTTSVFGIIYAAMIVMFCVVMKSWYPLIQFGVVLWGRIRLGYSEAPGNIKLGQVLVVASRMFLLLITAGIAAAIPLPHLGATPESLPMSGEGRMTEYPHMTLAWGFLYFVSCWYIYGRLVPKIQPKIEAFLSGRHMKP